MLLKPLVACCMVLAAGANVRADTFDLGPKGKLTVAVPLAWAATSQPTGTDGFEILFCPRWRPDAQINFTVIQPPVGDAMDRSQAETTFRAIANEAAADSMEKAANVKELTLPNGFAFYASFTDENVTSAETDSERWKTSTQCMLVLEGNVVVVATIFSDDLASRNFAHALALLQSVQFQPAG